MRFNLTYKPSIFTEMFNPADHRDFQSAFRKHDPKNKGNRRLAQDREWVSDIMDFWSEKMEVPKALAVTVFCTGDYEAIQRHYIRIKRPKAEKDVQNIRQSKVIDDEMRKAMMDRVLKVQKDIELVCKWDSADLANWCRATFLDALGTTHPSLRFDAHTKREKEKRIKVQNPKDPSKPRVERIKAKKPLRRKEIQQSGFSA